MADDVAKLQVEIDARTALLRTELSKASRDIAAFEKESRANLKRFDSNLDKAGRGGARFSKSMGMLKSSVAGFATGAVTGLVASFSVGAISGAITNALNFADAIGDTADQLGVSAEFLQEFRFATEEFGGSVEGADNALGKFNLSLGKAQSGNKAALAAYRELGVSVLDTSGKARSAEAVYMDVADAISRIESPTLQAAAAQKFFGKGYAEIIPLLRQGAKGYELTAERARELGIVLSDDKIARMGEAQRNLEVLNQTMNVQWTNVVSDNAAAISELSQSLADLVGWLLGGTKAHREFKAQIEKGVKPGPVIGPDGKPGMVKGSYLGGLVTLRDTSNAATGAKKAPVAQPSYSYDAPGWNQPVQTDFAKPKRSGFGLGLAAAVSSVDFGALIEAAQASQQLIDAEPILRRMVLDTSALGGETGKLSDEAAAYLDDLRTANQLSLMRAEGRTKEAEEAEALRRVESEIYRIDGLSAEQRRDLLRLAQAMTIESMRQVDAAEQRLALEDRWADAMGDASRPDYGAADENVQKVDDYFDNYRRKGEETQRYLADTFENLMTNGTKGVWAQFKSEAIRVIAELAAQALTNALGGLGGGGGGWGMGGGGGVLGGVLGGILRLPGFADGGSVQAGKPIIVGERRAELFVPNVPGRILPRVPQSGGGGETMVVEVDKSPLFDVHVRRLSAAEAAGQVRASQRGEAGRLNNTMTRKG